MDGLDTSHISISCQMSYYMVKRKGKPPEGAKRVKKVSMILDENLIRRAKMRALRENKSLTKLVNDLLGDYLKRTGEPEITGK